MQLRPLLLRGLAFALVIPACGPETDDSAGSSSGGGATADAPTGTTGVTGMTGMTGVTTSGDESGATTEAPPMVGECAQDSDCMLVNDCCSCSSVPVGTKLPPCEGNCLQSTCDALGRGDIEVACRSGVCEFKEVTCGEGPVACDEKMPTCDDGLRVSVKDGCWGPCVEPRYCADEPCPAGGCGAGWTCVEHQAGPSDCVVVPLECGGTLGCACAAPYIDEVCVGACKDDMGAVICQDGA